MSNDKRITPVDWLIGQYYDNEGMISLKQLERAKKIETEYIEQAELDAKEIVIIKECAERSTLDASSYAEGFTRGYNRALEYMVNSIENQIKIKQGEQ